MHLIAAQPGGFTDDEGIVDLGQSPARIVILAAADSALAALANSAENLPEDFPSIRLANWMQLLKPAAFDLYAHKVLEHAELVVVSLLGGASYWPYGYEQLQQWASEDSARQLLFVPGDDTVDEALFDASTAPREALFRVWRYLREGGILNNRQLLYFLADHCLQLNYSWREPQALPRCMIYQPASELTHVQASFAEWQQRSLKRPLTIEASAPVCLLLFYRSHLQSANTAMFDHLLNALEAQGLNPLPIAIASLKDNESLALVNALLVESRASLVLNTTGFASNTVASPELSSEPAVFRNAFVRDVPVLQLILASSSVEDWTDYQQGLRSRDVAMQVVLPEMDGRVITRAISHKSAVWYSERCELPVVGYALHRERAVFVARLAKRYCQLTIKSNGEKRLALILANYPTKDGRIGNGVGLDTPASTVNLLRALAASGYPVSDIPDDGDTLIKALLGSITNNPATLHHLPCWQSMDLGEYRVHFDLLPGACKEAVLAQWGEPEADPKHRDGRMMIAGMRLGQTFIGIQPARGFNMDLIANYHDPDLVPPHSYLAFYFWLRHCYRVDACVHIGKHGNLEWLPGKGSALSEQCWPDVALGPMPHFYPFIVNDPGEGAQAKRRTQAVIIDHLMPPMSRADTYGELADLETLVDELYQAMGMDSRREAWLREKIVETLVETNLLQELQPHSELDARRGDNPETTDAADNIDENVMLQQLDTYLCDIKEAQIRHGLHRLGELPENDKLADTLVALLRLPRAAQGEGQGILHALVADLQLEFKGKMFDPLQRDVEPWESARPALLKTMSGDPWRSTGDTRERLELLAKELIRGFVLNQPMTDGCNLQVPNDRVTSDDASNSLPETMRVIGYVNRVLMVALRQSARQEIDALVSGLSGRFVEPGPSGAPTRGRLDTLPTGRNFFSVDNRAIPSAAAWAIGQRSAAALIERHLQDHGDYPRQLGLSVWGTATMRTGGDDIAQAFALMGIEPVWAPGSQRVVDFTIVPNQLMNRPRVDVTLRVSGFFRDAFPNVMRLYDAAILALADFDDPGDGNSIKQHINDRAQSLRAQGMSEKEARRQASYRVFGSKPGAYGAGLQGLIDERCWETRSDLAEAYLNWGGYAYGSTSEAADGVDARAAFEHRLGQLEAVVHNQDNREHDVLDSDDYYQFQGGMTNAVTEFSGQEPVVYHNDHSNPATPVVRTLKEELNRVVRSRVLNPKWIEAMREHGYKGAFEMAASVDYLFAYDATTNLIDDYQYALVSDALVFDPVNQQFLQDHNPSALEEMAERLLEATQRNLWQDNEGYAARLQHLLLSLDEQREGQP